MTSVALSSLPVDASVDPGINAPADAAKAAHWQPVCPLTAIWPGTGVCALIQGAQVAIFHLGDGRVFALGNHDPKSGANVLSRGIIGDIAGEPVVASPIYKQHYRLRSGLCVEDSDVQLPTYAVAVRDGTVWVAR